jgi:hypothetical protein
MTILKSVIILKKLKSWGKIQDILPLRSATFSELLEYNLFVNLPAMVNKLS